MVDLEHTLAHDLAHTHRYYDMPDLAERWKQDDKALFIATTEKPL